MIARHSHAMHMGAARVSPCARQTLIQHLFHDGVVGARWTAAQGERK